MNETYKCPPQYEGKLFLSVAEMQEILTVGENKTYEFLKEAPFRVIRIGNQIKVLADSFWRWYFIG